MVSAPVPSASPASQVCQPAEQAADASGVRYRPSRYTAITTSDTGDLVLYNSVTGAVGTVPSARENEVRSLLHRQATPVAQQNGLVPDFIEGGFLVEEGTDEVGAVAAHRVMQKTSTDGLSLIILPTESCNLRCTYCYESFEHGTMPPSVREGLKTFVSQRICDFDTLTVQWFGGEPTMALDVVTEQYGDAGGRRWAGPEPVR